MKNTFYKHFFLSVLLVMMAAVQSLLAQGTTTATLTGSIADSKGETLIGAVVVATHLPSGSVYTAATREDGDFTIPNARVGGPYSVKITYVGYTDRTEENIFLKLGQTTRLPITLSENATVLSDVVISAGKNDLMSSTRMGSETQINREAIAALPTVGRDLTDFTRLTPQATVTGDGAISIAGANPRYNSIFIDGAVNNDVFGLSNSGTNGGQTGVSPISIDAIEQLQVVLSPYDVKLGGFAGGGINAVTRSGTNTTEGSVYGFYRNQELAGLTPTLTDSLRKKLTDFDSYTSGFRVGGAIIKNKLFYFINAEIQREAYPVQGVDFNSYRNFTQDSVNQFVNKLKSLGYDPGTFNGFTRKTIGDKFLVKLDYNINNNNKLSFRHSYAQSSADIVSQNSATTLNFSNNGYILPSITNSTALELNSIFGSKASNNLIIGYTNVNDDRDPVGKDFPRVVIRRAGVNTMFAGTEAFSAANQLKQNVITLTDNFNLYLKKHTLTFGTHNEYYDMYNLFIRQNYGEYVYDNLSDFLNDGRPLTYNRSYSLLANDITGDGSRAAAEFKALQLGLYVQDEFAVSKKLTITGGVRVDLPMFLNQPLVDTAFNNTHKNTILTAWQNTDITNDIRGSEAGKMPETAPLISPRVGFNYDVLGNRKLQVRGGAGIFTSRLPFVWAGGAYNNNGVLIGGVSLTRSGSGANMPTDFKFNKDPFNQPTATSLGQTQRIPSGEMNLFTKNFKYPQVFRTSLGMDYKFDNGLVATLEGLYTKTLNNINYYNINFRPTADTADLTGPDKRAYYSNRQIVSAYGSNVYLATNTNKGDAYNISLQLSKQFNFGLNATASYTYGDSRVLNEGTSSQNSSQWRTMENSRGLNNLDLSRSDFSLGHRVVTNLNYRIEYGKKNFATTVSLFYNGQSGTPVSYIVGGNLGGQEASNGVYLAYIPTTTEVTQMNFAVIGTGATAISADEQRNRLNAFIEADDYLKSRRGQYAERNGSRLPFQHIVDFRLLQDFYIKVKNGKRHDLQLSIDIFNIGNLINPTWGRRYFVAFDQFALLNLTTVPTTANRYTPTYQFRHAGGNFYNNDDSGINSSRWQGQVGLRYSF